MVQCCPYGTFSSIQRSSPEYPPVRTGSAFYAPSVVCLPRLVLVRQYVSLSPILWLAHSIGVPVPRHDLATRCPVLWYCRRHLAIPVWTCKLHARNPPTQMFRERPATLFSLDPQWGNPWIISLSFGDRRFSTPATDPIGRREHGMQIWRGVGLQGHTRSILGTGPQLCECCMRDNDIRCYFGSNFNKSSCSLYISYEPPSAGFAFPLGHHPLGTPSTGTHQLGHHLLGHHLLGHHSLGHHSLAYHPPTLTPMRYLSR